MTTMTHDHYQRGADAANRALDRTGATAREMLDSARQSEQFHRERGNHDLAEWAKGYADTVQEFLDDRSDV